MGRIVQTNIPNIDLGELAEIGRSEGCSLAYHRKEDTLYIRPDKPRPGTSLDWNGVWIRVDPETHEIIGVEIENFEGIFLKKHPELAKTWQDVRPFVTRKKQSRCDEQESFLLIILTFLRDLLNGPRQERLGFAPS